MVTGEREREIEGSKLTLLFSHGCGQYKTHDNFVMPITWSKPRVMLKFKIHPIGNINISGNIPCQKQETSLVKTTMRYSDKSNAEWELVY